MDYDLSRLSWRSFEQLVQALAVRHFGPGVVVFGDGPDGGREATFHGASRYAPHGEPWDGPGVVQAKFRQRPLGTELDGPWAIEALKQELAKMEAHPELQRPKHYVFATNVVLSPGRGGTKDQVIALLEDAKSTLGLRDFDVWDYDKLRTWIDVDEEVRTHFGWIVAGDVLRAMLEALRGATPEFERAIVNYLEKTLVTDRFVRLEEAGHSVEEQTALSQVFVDLPVQDDEAGDELLFMRRLLHCTATLSVDPATGDSREREQRVVLVGGPGQGKTTLGQFACQLLRASLLAERPPERLSPEGRDAVAAVRSACETAELPFGRGPRFPIRVVLTDLARALAERERPLLTYLAETIAARVGSSVPTDLFREWLGAHPWFLVLDGLDEVPANAGRDRVMRCVGDFWVDAAHVGADVVVLATTRPQGYNNDFSPERHEHIVLAELSPDRALHYGSRLAEARYGRDSERTATIKQRLREASEDPTTVHVMRSPLQVAIMTALVDRYGRPPQERWGLFAAYYDVIYQRERERDTDAARILREYRPEIDAIHEHVGLALQVLTTHGGHADPRLTGAQLERIIAARLEVEGHRGPEATAMIAAIRSAAELRLVFLVGAESDRIGFEIRSLQEFMAAGALVDGKDDEVIERLRAIAPLPSWRNVVLFGAGQCFVRKRHLRADLHDLCRALDVEQHEPLFAAAKLGSRLALDLLLDGTARRQPNQHRVIAQHALELLAIADDGLADSLAACHHDDIDDLYRTALADAVRGADEIERANARRCLLLLGKEGVAWALPRLRKHMPTTRRDVFRMLDGMSAQALEQLDADEIAACVAVLSPSELSWLRHLDLATRGELPSVFARQVRMAVSARPGLELNFVSIRPASPGPTQPVACAHAASPTLAVYAAAVSFWDQPTRESLAEALELVAREATPEIWSACAFELPWPLGVLLARADSSDELRQAAELAREGAYSDRGEWAAAERTWRKGFKSLGEAIAGSPPFPIEVAGASITPPHVPRGLPWLEDFRALRHAHPRQRERLASLIVGILSFVGPGRAAPTTLSDVIDVVAATAVESLYLGSKLLEMGGDDPERVTALIERLPEGARFRWYGPEPEPTSLPVDVLARHAFARPSDRAYEALAVALASTDARLRERVVLPEAATPVARASAAFIGFLTSAGDARSLGRTFATGDETTMGLLRSQVAQSHPAWAAFLVGVHDAAPRTWSIRRQLDALIGEVLSRRSMPLADAATWHALGLPEPHPLALA